MAYTLVRHTGYSTGGDLQFEHACELRSIEPFDEGTIRDLGGVVLPSYPEISNREHEENYPSGSQGLIPRVHGTFVVLKDFDEEIYLPPSKTTEDELKALRAYTYYIAENLERIDRDGWVPISFDEFLGSEELVTYTASA